MPDEITAPPPRRNCGAVAELHRLLETNPEMRERLSAIEATTRRSVASMRVAKLQKVTVPCVVHILYANAAQNISEAQIQSQLAVLNADYSATNADLNNVPAPWKSLAGDAKIQFKLATRDPDGAATSGITRTATDVEGFAADNSMKFAASGGVDAWNPDLYLNIWVCNLTDGLLGYAQFPGGPAATDGVVILNTAFGTTGIATAPFALGRTTTHEVGHYLNLIHIWGDTLDCSGTDNVADTPRQQMPNYNSPTFPHVSCNNGPNGDMFMNYMDYVDDAAMFMFTSGQVARMRATLAGPRKNLIRDAAQRT